MNNQLVDSAILALFFAQIMKIPCTYLVQGRWNWKAVLLAGGMPSSHTALMAGLTSACLFSFGWNSPYFAISFAVMLIVMYDAAGVRRQAGQQAIIINELTTCLQAIIPGSSEGKIFIKPSQLREVLGHNPVEVAGGVIVGFVTAFLVTR